MLISLFVSIGAVGLYFAIFKLLLIQIRMSSLQWRIGLSLLGLMVTCWVILYYEGTHLLSAFLMGGALLVCFVDLKTVIVKPMTVLAASTYHLSGKGEWGFEYYRYRKDELGEVCRNLLDHVKRLNRISAFVDNIVAGDFHTQYQTMGEYDAIGRALLILQGELNEHISEIDQVLREASQNGNLSAAIKTGNKSGAWKELALGINELLVSFYNPLKEVKSVMHSMSNRDLSNRFQSAVSGEIEQMKSSLNTVLDTLEGFFTTMVQHSEVIDSASREMRISGEEMRTATGEISSSISEMSQGADTQAAKVDVAFRLMEGILNNSKGMGHQAREVFEVNRSCAEKSHGGLSLIHLLAQDLDALLDRFDATVVAMNGLSNRSREIERVLQVIKDIAEQTNLLALNAAIEAAQAGDAGRGFSVVAEEIRKLADDSKTSVKEIQTLVTAVQEDTSGTSGVIDAMGVSVKTATHNLEKTSELFKEIYDATNSGLQVSQLILESSEHQVGHINEVVRNVESVVVIAEQTAAASGQISASASELSAGMNTFSEKVTSLSDIALTMKERLSLVKFSKKKTEEPEAVLS